MQFRPISFYHGITPCYRPSCMDITPSGRLLVGYTGYDKHNSMRDTKMVHIMETQLWRSPRKTLYYKLGSTTEICPCTSVSLAVNARTYAATLWISDCEAESRLLRVHLSINWRFLHVLLLAVFKPTHRTCFALLPICVYNGSTCCPILDHIIAMLKGICAFF